MFILINIYKFCFIFLFKVYFRFIRSSFLYRFFNFCFIIYVFETFFEEFVIIISKFKIVYFSINYKSRWYNDCWSIEFYGKLNLEKYMGLKIIKFFSFWVVLFLCGRKKKKRIIIII